MDQQQLEEAKQQWREEKIKNLSSERRALYESVIGKRDQIRKIDGFNIVKTLRKLRGST